MEKDSNETYKTKYYDGAVKSTVPSSMEFVNKLNLLNDLTEEQNLESAKQPKLVGSLFSKRIYVDYFDQFPTHTHKPPVNDDNTNNTKANTAVKTSNTESTNEQDGGFFTVYYVPLPPDEKKEKQSSEIDESQAHSVMHLSNQQSLDMSKDIKPIVHLLAMKGNNEATPSTKGTNKFQSTGQINIFENLYRFVLGGVSGSKVRIN